MNYAKVRWLLTDPQGEVSVRKEREEWMDGEWLQVVIIPVEEGGE